MESGRFTGFSKNGPFGKPGILRGFQGLRGPIIADPVQLKPVSGMMMNRDNLPGTLFMQKLQEFCIKQGVVRSQSELNLGPV
jgi:hypothetical protein